MCVCVVVNGSPREDEGLPGGVSSALSQRFSLMLQTNKKSLQCSTTHTHTPITPSKEEESHEKEKERERSMSNMTLMRISSTR